MIQKCIFLWLFLRSSATGWSTSFDPSQIDVQTNSEVSMQVFLSDLSERVIENINEPNFVLLRSSNEEIAVVVDQDNIRFERQDGSNTYQADFRVGGVFLGEFLDLLEAHGRQTFDFRSN